MFLVKGNRSVRETLLMQKALASVSDLLPPAWRLETASPPQATRRLEADGLVRLVGPRGTKASFIVEAKPAGASSIDSLRLVLADLSRTFELPVLFVSDYIGPSLREALASEGISYADATGWVRVVNDDPLILLTGIGADRAPRPRQSGSAVARLNGVAANRIIRALCATPVPVGVRELALIAGASAGSVSKLLVTLAGEGIVERDAGAVVLVRRRALVRRWVADYSFNRSNPLTLWCLAPRGVERTLEKVAGLGGAVLTGSAAARRLLPSETTSVVPLRQIAVYADDPPLLADQWGLVEADAATANVLIARPQDIDILRVGKTSDGLLPIAPTALVLADLLTLPGRSDAEAEQLMDALALRDAVWRE